jgi:phosphotriesterase-related protein
MSVVRTVLGDVPSSQLGVCYAHEHLVIDGGVAKIINPEISLQRVDDAVDELGPCVAAGLGAVVDAMPADAGRNVAKLAAISRRAGVHIVAATGLHHARYYGERHWGELLEPPEMAELFAGEVEHGIDAHDLNGPVLRRTPHRAGVVKVAGSAGGPSDRDRRVFEAAAIAVAQVGAAVLTHCEGGTGAVAQLRLLDDLGVPLDRVILSHTDKVVDRGYHRELLAAGAYVVYDQGIRSPEGTARLVRWMVEDGHEGQLLLGTDGARRSLWTVLGGSPGLAALRNHLG